MLVNFDEIACSVLKRGIIIARGLSMLAIIAKEGKITIAITKMKEETSRFVNVNCGASRGWNN